MEIKENRERVVKKELVSFGIVEKLSVQGDFLYAVVRKEGILRYTESNVPFVTDQELFGANGVREQDLILSEVLIPTDILPSMVTMSYDFFIGKKAEVILDGEIPRIVLLSRVASTNPPRGISIRDIKVARKETLADPLPDGYLRTIGHDENLVVDVIGERYNQVSNSQDVLTYGDEIAWDINLSLQSQTGTTKDMTKIIDVTHVSGLKGAALKSSSCYMPILTIGGKV